MSSVAFSAGHTAVPEDSDVTLLRARVEELTRERDQMAVAVDILQEVSSSLHFTEILQGIARRWAISSALTAARSTSRAMPPKKCGWWRRSRIPSSGTWWWT
jgi:hypothetical protein